MTPKTGLATALVAAIVAALVTAAALLVVWRAAPGVVEVPVPDAREFIDRRRVKQYPTLALFDGSGRLLGTRRGGVRDELEAATVAPQLARWVDGLLRSSKAAAAR